MWENIDLPVLSRILLTGLSSAIFTGILAFLVQKYIERWLRRGLEQFKVDLQLSAYEHQTRFTKLYEKRADVTAELYRRLAKVPNCLMDLGFSIRSKPAYSEKTIENNIEAKEAIMSFSNYYKEHRIYFPQNLCSKIEELDRQFNTVFTDFTMASVLKIGGTRTNGDEENKSANKTLEDYANQEEIAIESLVTTRTLIQQEIDTEFRKSLGSFD